MKEQAPDVASVMVVTQASFLLMAGLVALPFGIVEPGYRVLGLLTIVIAAALYWLARNLRRRRRWARRCVMALESMSLLASLLLMLIPIGAIRGPVPVLVNLVLPATTLWLLWSARAVFGAGASGSHA